jgi:8-oxo-dGDP phosphatase
MIDLQRYREALDLAQTGVYAVRRSITPKTITGRWGWEIPMGMIDPGETPAQAAAREVEEETGWRPGQLQPLLLAQPTAGIMDAAHHIFTGTGATQVSAPADRFESTAVQWVPLGDVPGLIAKQDIISASTMAALLLLLGDSGQTAADARPGDAPRLRP